MASPGKTPRRRGRREGDPVSRDVVLAAAKSRFAADGYERTTLRAVATALDIPVAGASASVAN